MLYHRSVWLIFTRSLTFISCTIEKWLISLDVRQIVTTVDGNKKVSLYCRTMPRGTAEKGRAHRCATLTGRARYHGNHLPRNVGVCSHTLFVEESHWKGRSAQRRSDGEGRGTDSRPSKMFLASESIRLCVRIQQLDTASWNTSGHVSSASYTR